ncbi:MAG TPA: response regulator [Flavisolibacter sp.]|jgi:CheY-like chemotaxis protein|nr:response regulator [Flavisolibacter sp.]
MTDHMLAITRILLADDDADDRFIFEALLREVAPGISLDFVSNGNDLLALLQHYIPDLLFLDLEMPYKNGLECLVEIRSHAQLKDLPVVVFSSTTRPANIQTAYEMGAHLFFIKSPKVSVFTEALHAILGLDWSRPERIKAQYHTGDRYLTFNEAASNA